MSNKLLPCPFCGGAAAYQRLRDGSEYGAFECGECGAQGPDVRTGYGPEEEWREKATAAWNERSAATPPAAAHGDEAVRKDAERYRWLRNGGQSGTSKDPKERSELVAGYDCSSSGGFDTYCEPVRGEALDEAIDAAMRAPAGEGGE